MLNLIWKIAIVLTKQDLLMSQQMFGFSNFDMASVTSIPRHITEDRKYHRSAWPKTPKTNRTEEW